jgi:4-amino-4-deoxy-L-arabinose transferase-like glycosyltransferase
MYAPMGAPPPAARQSGMAIAGFVLSLVALLPCFWVFFQIPGVLGVIFSVIGLRATKRQMRRGRGLAVAGLVVGSIAIAIAVLFTLYVYTSDNCITDGLTFECNFNG